VKRADESNRHISREAVDAEHAASANAVAAAPNGGDQKHPLLLLRAESDRRILSEEGECRRNAVRAPVGDRRRV
jgi:hypothetical protein